MSNPRKYATYADFEKEEYLCVKSFYENLEDIADEGIFNPEDDEEGGERRHAGKSASYAAELEF